MEDNRIIFKGTKDGVIVEVSGYRDYETLKEAMISKLCNANNFFRGGKLYIDFTHAYINEECQEKIKRLIFDDYNISTISIERDVTKGFNGIYEGRTKFIRNTIRSGQNIEFSGNIVVIGDINAGSKILAAGNVVALGAVRGMVHAGASGNKKAIIAAFTLQPTQLRIADVISRAPDGDSSKPICPELARIRGNSIVIEPYVLNKYF